MKFRTVTAGLCACAAALSVSAVTASAAITNPNADDKYMFVVAENGVSNLPDGCALTDVYGFSAKLSINAGADQTCEGGLCYQSDSNNWAQVEFCKEGGEKSTVIAPDGTVKMLKDTPLFAAGDTWAKVFVAEWSWEGDNQADFAVEGITLLNRDGNPLAAGSASPTAASAAVSESAPAETVTETQSAATEKAESTADAAKNDVKTVGTAESSKKAEPSSETGDAGAALAFAGLVTAGAAAYLTRRRH